MSKWLKMAFVSIPLLLAAYLFGRACQKMGQAYEVLMSPSKELLVLLLWFVLAMAGLSVSAGLVAALVRPPLAAAIPFAVSGVVLLLGWQVSEVSALLAALYVLAGIAYSLQTCRELDQRIAFSAEPVGHAQGLLRAALVIVACGSLYLGAARQIRREGFRIPEKYTEVMAEQMGKQIAAQAPSAERQEVITQVREQFQRTMDGFVETAVERYGRFIPLLLAASIFTSLLGIANLVAWVPTVALGLLFPVLTALGITRVTTETMEVRRLVIE